MQHIVLIVDFFVKIQKNPQSGPIFVVKKFMKILNIWGFLEK